ncbi:MAG TPA: STM3941 family protein [Gemmatimonadales bacterium]|jgi:hypothetical protein
MERLVLRTARRHIYRKLAICVSAAGVGVGLASIGLAPWLGWAVGVIAGVPALIMLRGLGEETERIVIDDAGIRDTHLPIGVIGWTEIKGATVQTIGGAKVVNLELKDPERMLRRLPPARQFIARKALEAGLPVVYLALRGIDFDPTRIAELISRRARMDAGW